MQLITTTSALQEALANAHASHRQIGLVPTMGALHPGHRSLIERARRENDVVVVSVFVNPIQFNNQEDLAKYPRTAEADCQLLQHAGADIAFLPWVEEMYPTPVTDVYHFGALEEVMEGPQRPGHFSGVAVVVRRLFDLVQPTRAYFGEKDLQQLAIIRNLIAQIGSDIDIVACPIVRDDDGLALSSRNMRLSSEARRVAPLIYATLREAVLLSSSLSMEQVKHFVLSKLTATTLFEPEYFEIVDDSTLQPIANWGEGQGVVGCIAVWLDGVRLIDMVRFRP